MDGWLFHLELSETVPYRRSAMSNRMHLGQLVVRNAFRSPFRSSMTVLTMGVMLTAFVFPRTLVDAQERHVRDAPNDRVIVLSKLGWDVPLPARYADEIRGMSDIRLATGVRQAGLMLPGKETAYFVSNAVDPEPFIEMHRELVAPEREKRSFISDTRSAMVSLELARQFGWKLGDRVVFRSWAYPGEWQLTIECIFEARGGEWARRTLYLHYDYLNRSLSGDHKDKVNLVSAQVIEPDHGGQVARALDLHFDAEAVRTVSMEDRVLTAANVGRIGALLSALDYISYVILLVVLAILANTLTLNVRERTREFGVLRAIGFGSSFLYALVLGEAALLGCVGSALGLGLSYPLLEGLVGPYLQENLQVSPMRIPLVVTLTAFVAGVLLSILAALLPVRRATRLAVHEALRHIG